MVAFVQSHLGFAGSLAGQNSGAQLVLQVAMDGQEQATLETGSS